MPTPQFQLPGGDSPEALRDYIVKLQRDLQYLLTNLDDLNVSRLNARVIVAESITTDKLAAGSITTDKLDAGAVTADKIVAGAVTTDKLDAGAVTADKIDAGAVTTDKLDAGAVTADKITVSELSAIAANLGTITAGLMTAVTIIGSYIATAAGTYPRCEMSSIDNLFAAYNTADDYVSLQPDVSGAPTLSIVEGGVARLGMNYSSALSQVALLSTAHLLLTSVGGDIELQPSLSGKVKIPDWTALQNATNSQTLQQALNGKADIFVGATGVFDSQDGKTVVVNNGIITAII